MKQNIEWHQAQQVAQQVTKEQAQRQQEMLDEFLTSNCDSFSFADWQYYADETGKSIDWLREHATYSDSEGEYGTLLNNAMLDNDHELIEEFFI